MATNANLAPFINVEFYVTGSFGEDRGSHIHKGVDLSTGKKSPVYSLSKGTVILRTSGGGYGDYVIVKSEDGMGFLYGDLDSNVLVSQGDEILQGQQIGFEGNPRGTTSTGLHVHIEQQDIKNHEWNYNWSSGYFINPCIIMGIENKVDYSKAYFYNGVPVPTKTKNKWKYLYFKKYNINFRR